MPAPRPGLPALAPHRSTTAALLAGAARGRGMEVAVLPVGGVPYAVHGLLDAAPLAAHPREPAVRAFTRRLGEACGVTLPGAAVLDVGRTLPAAGPGSWAVVEANMAWFSNVYAADPGRALDAVLRSAGPEGLLRDRDRAFRRAVPTASGAARGVAPE